MRACLIEPENCRHSRGAGPCHGKLRPILNGRVLRLAHAPDVAAFDVMFEQDGFRAIQYAHSPSIENFERLVMRTIFLGRPRHEPNIGHGAHGARIEGSVLFAEGNGLAINSGIAAVGDYSLRILELTV